MKCECAICKDNKAFEMPEEIVKATKNGNIAIFCGAGISTESKLVLPFSFYTSILNELEMEDTSLSFSDLMQQYCQRPNGHRELLKKIRERFEYIHSFPEIEKQATKFHRELQEIHLIKTIITTNWDTYFEDCCSAIPITIPEDFVFWNSDERFVLKIHGSIDNLSTVVATKTDYDECFARLEKGIIGATLKTILANNTVVFIGFSFEDEDFLQILDYLKSEMGSLLPHIYIVTVDENMSEKINYTHCTCVVTDGTFFIHQLKLALKKDGYIVNCDSMPHIETAHDDMGKLHLKISKIDATRFPCNVLCLAYQDGVLHAFERFMQLYKKGIYNIPGMLASSARAYKKKTTDSAKAGNHWDEAYYEGYSNGLILIEACNDNPSILKDFPFLYLPNAKKALGSYSIYIEELERVTRINDTYNIFSSKVVKNHIGDDLVAHHPPY